MKKTDMTYKEIEKAVNILGLIGIENSAKIKKIYLKLSKKHHPDMPEGDEKKFQEINKAYKLLEKYMKEYRFTFSKEEFYEQYPHAKEYNGDLMWGKRH